MCCNQERLIFKGFRYLNNKHPSNLCILNTTCAILKFFDSMTVFSGCISEQHVNNHGNNIAVHKFFTGKLILILNDGSFFWEKLAIILLKKRPIPLGGLAWFDK